VIPDSQNLQRAGAVIASAFAGRTTQLDHAGAVIAKALSGTCRSFDDVAEVVAKFHQEER
jgi:hypothetical protein